MSGENVDRRVRWLYEQVKRIYANRTTGCNRNYCLVNGGIDAGTTAGQETGKGGGLSGEPAPVGAAVCNTGRG